MPTKLYAKAEQAAVAMHSFVMVVYEETDEADAGFELGNGYSYQMSANPGRGYLHIVNRWDEAQECMYHMGEFTSWAAALERFAEMHRAH